MCGSKKLIKLLEEAKSSQKLEFHYSAHETTGISNTLWTASIMLIETEIFLIHMTKKLAKWIPNRLLRKDLLINYKKE